MSTLVSLLGGRGRRKSSKKKKKKKINKRPKPCEKILQKERGKRFFDWNQICLLYTSDAADE